MSTKAPRRPCLLESGFGRIDKRFFTFEDGFGIAFGGSRLTLIRKWAQPDIMKSWRRGLAGIPAPVSAVRLSSAAVDDGWLEA